MVDITYAEISHTEGDDHVDAGGDKGVEEALQKTAFEIRSKQRTVDGTFTKNANQKYGAGSPLVAGRSDITSAFEPIFFSELFVLPGCGDIFGTRFLEFRGTIV